MLNPLSCTQNGVVLKGILGTCSLWWFGFAAIVFLVLIARRQADDGILAGTGFNTPGAIIGAFGGYLAISLIFSTVRFGLLAGVAGLALGGFLLGRFIGGGD